MNSSLLANQSLDQASGSVWSFFASGGVFMALLVALSLLSIAVIIYKARTLRREVVMPASVESELERAEEWRHDTRRLQDFLASSPSTLSRIGDHTLQAHYRDKEEARQGIQARAREEVVHLETGIALLEVVITVAPLLGLLGTASGLVTVFSNREGSSQSDEYATLARGIAEALNTTIAGLAVAVPTVFAHSYFTKKIEKMAVRMEVLVSHLVNVVYQPPREAPVEPEINIEPAQQREAVMPGEQAEEFVYEEPVAELHAESPEDYTYDYEADHAPADVEVAHEEPDEVIVYEGGETHYQAAPPAHTEQPEAPTDPEDLSHGQQQQQQGSP